MSGLTIRNNGMGTVVWNLNKNQSRMRKALEHLSSGYRINRSGDDAAGLSISERMRSQIRGLNQAADNCNEGIRLISVGEGILTEVHSMLQRANVLALQSANRVCLDERDRESLQEELDQICAEIDRITENANYNGIRLFQNFGYQYETSSEAAVELTGQITPPGQKTAASAQITQPRQKTAASMRTTPSGIRLAAGTQNASAAIQPAADAQDTPSGTQASTFAQAVAYSEKADADSAVYAAPRAAALDNGVGGELDIIVSDSGQRLSGVLRDEIVPNVVKNLLANYAAFSGLEKGSVGIGLRLYNDNSSKTLAFLSNEISRDTSSVRAYSLNVNLNCLRKMADDDTVRAELEAAVTKEITRAFLYETAGAGMLGVKNTVTSAADRFPEWFIEGMTLTASGAGEWLGYMGLDKGSDAGQIAAVLKNSAARLDSGSPLSINGTGYLACMYLGAMSGGVCGKVDPNAGEEVISRGLSNLLVLAGSQRTSVGMTFSENPLDDAIRELSLGRFTSAADFCEKFSTDDEVIAEAANLISGLLKKTGDGRGGLATGDLSATDLAADGNGGALSLFRLNISQGVVRNTSGVIIKAYKPVRSGYGDLFVSGVEHASDIEYDEASNTLTIRGGENIELSMKSGVTSSALNKIVVEGASRVTLNGVKLTNANALTIKNDAEIVYSGYNELGGINLTEKNGVDFLGTGQLKINEFTTGSTDNRVRFAGGAVLVPRGVGKVTNIIVDDAMVYANGISVVNSEGKSLINDLMLRWADVYSIREITSVELDGKRIDLLLKRDDICYLWREAPEQADADLYKKNHLTLRGSGGTVQNLETKRVKVQNPGQPTFYRKEWAPLTDGFKTFKVTGGVEGRDYTIGTDGTLTILSSAQMTITGGLGLAKGNPTSGKLGAAIYGKIKVADNIGNVNLILDDVVCDHASNVSAFDLGKGNDVNLTLASGSTNVFKSGGNYNHAGIALGAGTNVTINSAGGVGSTDGKLVASGTVGAAGIGSNGTGTFQRGETINPATTSCGNITINGGTIEATGGERGGAGIGGANYGSCGKITINGGDIKATGQEHGAGIGGGWYDADRRGMGNGAITITGGHITAVCVEHGTGIGAGCMGTSGAITITGDAVIEQAKGGVSAAGIGASASGRCTSISILGNAKVENAVGGANGAGIGAGASEPNRYGSSVGEIVINTTGSVVATGGESGVGIGCGPSAVGTGSEGSGLSSCGDIRILGGVVDAAGGVNSTGIGAGRGSVSGAITIGDESGQSMVVVTATGGMSFNGGNILSYTDSEHTAKGELRIVGGNTTVRAGYLGEGRYSTSGAVNQDGTPIFAYPLYLLVSGLLLPAGDGLENFPLTEDVDRNSIRITATGKSDGTTFSWTPGLSHAPLEKGYDFIWMTGQDQELTVEYQTASGGKKSYTLELVFDDPTGIFRTKDQETLDELAQIPDYYPKGTKPDKIFYLPQNVFDPAQDPFPNGKPDAPVPIPGGSNPKPPNPPDPPGPNPPDPPSPSGPSGTGAPRPQSKERGGIILQVGASSEETLAIPRFYLSLEALEMGEINIATQQNAWNAITVIQNAIQRVSTVRGSYGAFANRLEHNVLSLRMAEENIQAAESRIRDADIAKESADQLVGSICTQSAQAMLSQCNMQAGWILRLLQ